MHCEYNWHFISQTYSIVLSRWRISSIKRKILCLSKQKCWLLKKMVPFWSVKASVTKEWTVQFRNKVIWVLNNMRTRVSRQWQNFHFCLNYPFNYRDRNRCLPILEAVIHNATLLKCVISPHLLQIHQRWPLVSQTSITATVASLYYSLCCSSESTALVWLQ